MRLRLSCLVLLLHGACTSHEGEQPQTRTEPEPPVLAAPQIAFRGAIASVSMIQNCPDPEPSAAASADEAMQTQSISAGSAIGGGGGGGWSQPCTQSTMQLTLSHDAREAQRFTIKAARLTAAGTGAQLATIPFRGPTKWDDAGRYVAWDESLPANGELKASYKLGEPDWTLVAKALGVEDTHAPRYVLELDVEIAGQKITLRSPEFQREHPDVIVT